MNILYMSQTDIDINSYSIYSDFVRALGNRGHNVTLLCSSSKIKKDERIEMGNLELIKIKVGNQFGVNLIKKAIVILSLKGKMKKAIKRYVGDKHFDLIVYFTPPITFARVVKYCKKKYHCKSYLVLKDIFPQNAVDLKMLTKTGLKGFIYRYFKSEEKLLYTISDRIGCMSKMNMSYLIENYSYLDKNKIEYFPNSAIIRPLQNKNDREWLDKLNIPKETLVFVYGGNLGKPQGLVHFVNCLEKCQAVPNINFIVVGKGGEKEWLFNRIKGMKNVTTLDCLTPEEYNKLCVECDVGLVLLDKNFTIPNYPSRMLSYMENAKPIFACVDRNNDVPELIQEADCGNYCFSDNVDDFVEKINWFIENKSKLKAKGLNGRRYYEENFNVENYLYKLENLIKEKNYDRK